MTDTTEYVTATDEDKTLIADYVDSAPKPNLSRPKNRRFLKGFVNLWAAAEREDENGGAIFDVLADIDDAMERILGSKWVTWIESIPHKYQDAVMYDYMQVLMADLGKD